MATEERCGMEFLCRLVEQLGDESGAWNDPCEPISQPVQATWLREQGGWTGANEVKEDWVLLEGRACEIARAEAHFNLQKAREEGTVRAYLQSLKRRGHVGLANVGMTILAYGSISIREQDLCQQQDLVKLWMAWLDWEVRFVRPSWEANVTTWNLGPLGYEYSRTQLRQLLQEGQAVVMVQEMRFPLGVRQRVKNELRHLYPEYHCFLETGNDQAPSDEEGGDMVGYKSQWCKRENFAVATFLHRGVFKTALRKEWHVDRDTRVLRHMTRGRVLRVDAELHDGRRLQVFNVHQATSGDLPLQQHTWQVLTKSIMECRHQHILLGGDP
jgi:hypothetical protein